MSHHGSQDGGGWPFPSQRKQEESALREAMKKLMGEYPNGRLNKDDAGAVAVQIGEESGRVVMRFPKPVAWIGFTGDEAMEIAQVLIKHARKAGITAPVVIRIGE